MVRVFGETRNSILFSISVGILSVLTIKMTSYFNDAIVSGVGVILVMLCTFIRRHEIQHNADSVTKLICLMYILFLVGGYISSKSSLMFLPYGILISVIYSYMFNGIAVQMDDEEFERLQDSLEQIERFEDRELRNKRNFSSCTFNYNKGYSYNYTTFGFIKIKEECIKDRNRKTILSELQDCVKSITIDNYLKEYGELSLSKFNTVRNYYNNLLLEYNKFEEYMNNRQQYYSDELRKLENVVEYKNLGKDLTSKYKSSIYLQNISLEYNETIYLYDVIFICNKGVLALGDLSTLSKILDVDIELLNTDNIESLQNSSTKLNPVKIKSLDVILIQHKVIEDNYNYYDFREEVESNVNKFKKEIENNKNKLEVICTLNKEYIKISNCIKSVNR